MNYYCPHLLGGRHCAKDISYVSSFDYQNKSNVRYYYNPPFIDLILQSYKNFKLSSIIKFSICTKVKQVKKTLFKATAVGERGLSSDLTQFHGNKWWESSS